MIKFLIYYAAAVDSSSNMMLPFPKSSYLIAKRNLFTTSILRKRIFRYPKLVSNEIIQHPLEELKEEDELLNSLKNKLVYSSYVSRRNNRVRWRVRYENMKQQAIIRRAPVIPLSLKYMYDESQLNLDEFKAAFPTESEDEVKSDAVKLENKDLPDNVNFPYDIVKKVEFVPGFTEIERTDATERSSISKFGKDVMPNSNVKMWMSDYHVFEELDFDEVGGDLSEYGTADPNILPSNIPCGGCGAHLHCQNASIPGYLPKELFLRCSENDLRSIVCQRCTFLKNYDIALSVNVDPESYPKLLSSIRHKNALVIVMVDMLDFPCSIWPQLLKIIGKTKEIILVGNKVDLLPGDSSGWLAHAKKVLLKYFPGHANVIHVALISAKTGFGVEELITQIQNKWENRGDVYLIGCTNVGKSSLFNALLQSDFCRTEAIDLVQRATVSPWPGTTLNLLKFPILRMNAWRRFKRTSRLIEERRLAMAEKQLERLQAKATKTPLRTLPQIVGLIGSSFLKDNTSRIGIDDDFTMPSITPKILKEDDKKVFNPDSLSYQQSKFCYDTPGVVHQDQIINILTTEELMKTLPQRMIIPRMYSIYPKQSLLIGGLARIDLVDCDAKMARLVVYASQKLPVTVCYTEYVEEVYNTLLGSKYLGVPCGDSKRLEKWPPLKSVRDFDFVGEGQAISLGDIVLSSAGWVCPVAYYGVKFTIRPFTPDGRGIYLRTPSLLRYTAKLRRRRMYNTPTYFMSHAI